MLFVPTSERVPYSLSVYHIIASKFSRLEQTRGEKEKSIEEKSLLLLRSFFAITRIQLI